MRYAPIAMVVIMMFISCSGCATVAKELRHAPNPPSNISRLVSEVSSVNPQFDHQPSIAAIQLREFGSVAVIDFVIFAEGERGAVEIRKAIQLAIEECASGTHDIVRPDQVGRYAAVPLLSHVAFGPKLSSHERKACEERAQLRAQTMRVAPIEDAEQDGLYYSCVILAHPLSVPINNTKLFNAMNRAECCEDDAERVVVSLEKLLKCENIRNYEWLDDFAVYDSEVVRCRLE